MAINLATTYSPKVDEIINAGNLSDSAINHEYEFVGAQTVKVYSMGTAEMHDYNASGTSRYGTPTDLEDTVQEMTMTKKRSFTAVIDKTHAVDSPEGVRDAGKALRRQIDLKIIPEVDTYRFSKIADNAATKDYTAVTSSNAYSKFLDANGAIDDKEMPVEGRVAYVSPKYFNLIKLDSNFVKASDIAQEMLIKGQVGEIDGVKIVKVPAKRLPAGASFIITNPMSTPAPVKLEDYKIHSDPPGIAGHLIEGLVYYDAFVLDNKKDMIATQYGDFGTLTLTMEVGASGKGTLTITGNTNGGKLVYKTAASVTAATLGGDVSSWTAVPTGGVISATTGHKVAVAIDVDGKAVAASEAITVAVGA